MMTVVNSILLLTCLFITGSVHATENADALYKQATELFEAGDYDKAMLIMEKVIDLSPVESKYHHLLGKVYGRIAENGSWIRAMSYAKKCLRSFQKSVELDDENTGALNDLKRFYEEAPGFLGGSKKKAKEIGSRLQSLSMTDQT